MGWAGRLRPRGLGWLVAVTAILVIIAAVAGEPWWPIVVTAVTGVAASIVFTAVRRWRGVAGAKAAYQRAIESGHADAAPVAAFNLGLLLEQQGDGAGAKAAYQQTIDSGHAELAPRAAVSLGVLLEQHRGTWRVPRRPTSRRSTPGTPTRHRGPFIFLANCLKAAPRGMAIPGWSWTTCPCLRITGSCPTRAPISPDESIQQVTARRLAGLLT
jgi:hypothetical protein